MASGGTQGSTVSQKTQPLSWELEHFGNGAKTVGLDRANDGSFSYIPGQTGHVDLTGLFEQPLPEPDDLHTQHEEELGIESPVDVRTEIFPEERRFQVPKTPATNGKRRNRDGDILDPMFSTPRLPPNPFAQMGNPDAGVMGLTQVFGATQAPSSPCLNVIPSDANSERPSPNMFSHLHRSSTGLDLSSPAKIPLPPLHRVSSEPHADYVSMRDSQAEREKRHQEPGSSSPLSKSDQVPELSDDEFDRPPSHIEQQLRQKRREQEAKPHFDAITAKPRISSSADNVSRKRRRGQNEVHSSPIRNKDSHIPIITLIESESGNVTEEETEQEDFAEVMPDEPELGEENKENLGTSAVLVPNTILRTAQRSRLLRRSPQSSPTVNRPRSKSGGESPDELAENVQSQRTPSSSQQRSSAHEESNIVAVEDSQRSQSKIGAVSTAAAPVSGLVSSGDSRKIIPQSQAWKGSSTSHVKSSMGRKEVEPSQQSTPPESSPGVRDQSSPSFRRSPRKRGQVLPSSPPMVSDKSAKVLPSKPENGTTSRNRVPGEVILASNSIVDIGPGLSPQLMSAIGQHDTPIGRKATLRSTIPETESAIRYHNHESLSRTVNTVLEQEPVEGSSKGPDLDTGASTGFDTAQSRLTASPSRSRMQSLRQSPQRSPGRAMARKPRKFTDIAADPSPPDELGSIDIDDVGLMTTEDVEFQNQMAQIEGFSPVGPAQKKRRGRNGRSFEVTKSLDVPEVAVIEPTASLPIPAIGVVGPIQPNQEHSDVESDAIKPSTIVDRSANHRARFGPLPLSKIFPISPPSRHVKSSVKTKSVASKQNISSEDEISRAKPPLKTYKRKSKDLKPILETSNATTPVADNIQQALNPDLAVVAPSRVFANFNGTPPGYFPATCLGVTGAGERYKVQFDDGSTSIVNSHLIRRLELRVGDQVKVYRTDMWKKTYVVLELRAKADSESNNPEQPTDIYGHREVVVSLKSEKTESDTRHVVSSAEVYHTKTTWPSLKDRQYSHTVSGIRDSGVHTPSERATTPSTPNSRFRSSKSAKYQDKQTSSSLLSDEKSFKVGSNLFSDIVFAVTSIADPTARKHTESTVRSNGGQLLKGGFEELFQVPPAENLLEEDPDEDDGSSDSDEAGSSKLKKPTSAFSLTPIAADQSTFAVLIADRHSRNSKFFQALALGIPCVSTRWVKDCVAAQKIRDWRPYLLASGESAYLGGAVVSRTLNWIPSQSDGVRISLEKIIEKRFNWLGGTKVLLVGAGGADALTRMEAYVFLAYALGAKKVGIVASKKEAQTVLSEVDSDEAETWDWICVHEDEKSGRDIKSSNSKKRKRGATVDEDEDLKLVSKAGAKVVGTEFVMQSLIMGKLLEDL